MRTVIALVLGVTLLAAPPASAAERPSRLTNLAHLDFLRDSVAPPAQAGHTTYRLAQEPRVGMLWTYADARDGGTFERIGGGTKRADGSYTQGAFNADDVARAAVVYLRDWRQTGSSSSRKAAYELLRGLTYLQTATGRNAGNVVLWMQPDGTLNRSAEPVELPDPSDSDASYWLARTVWALGEAYPAFRRADPAFARFLKARLDLAVRAVERQSLDAYGTYQQVDGRRTPAWLIADGADASAEAVLGLAAYLRSTDDARAARVARRLSEGIAQLSAGDARHFPFGAVMPWALSRSQWHAWSSQMPAALADAGRVLGERSFTRAAARDSFTFTPWLLTSGGPDNGRQPTASDRTQIAYGIDSRVQSLLATRTAIGDRLAGMTAAWFFGANASKQPTYDPATGVTFDGVGADGTPNRNSGAESTIHGLLTMLALDAHPGVARIARTATVRDQRGVTTLEAEDATLGGGATPVAPASTWTGESQYGGTGYVSLPVGGTVRFETSGQPAALVMPVVELLPGSTGRSRYDAASLLGRVDAGDVGPQGTSPAPGALLPVTLSRTLRPGQDVTATGERGSTRLDALVVQPLLTWQVLGGGGHGTALARNAGTSAGTTNLAVPGSGTAVATSYDGLGRQVSRRTSTASTITVHVPAGGFTLVRR